MNSMAHSLLTTKFTLVLIVVFVKCTETHINTGFREVSWPLLACALVIPLRDLGGARRWVGGGDAPLSALLSLQPDPQPWGWIKSEETSTLNLLNSMCLDICFHCKYGVS